MTLLRPLSAVALLLAVAACSVFVPSDAPPAGTAKPAFVATSDPATCTAQGGEMRAVGRMQSQQCVVTFTDAGQTCTDSSQCQGECQVRGAGERIAATPQSKGQCTTTSADRFGCYAKVANGVVGNTICVD